MQYIFIEWSKSKAEGYLTFHTLTEALKILNEHIEHTRKCIDTITLHKTEDMQVTEVLRVSRTESNNWT